MLSNKLLKVPMIRATFLSICLAWPQLGEAIVIRHDVEDAEYRLLGAQFNGIVTFRNSFGGVAGMGTLINDRWVLTAAHVANGLGKGGIAKVGGESITVQAVVKHPEWKWEAKYFVYDVALVRVSKPSSSIQRAALYSGDSELGKTVLLIGRGDTGNGRDGKFIADDILRGANNTITEVDEHRVKFIFDPPTSALPLEGISGPGDSGGPALIYSSGQYQVVGVSSTQNTKPSGGTEGVYGVVENYIRVSKYRLWIEAVIEK